MPEQQPSDTDRRIAYEMQALGSLIVCVLWLAYVIISEWRAR
jgi:hypothetical protein